MTNQTPPPAPEGFLHAATARVSLGGFFLAGLLMSFLGPILPAWGYHLGADFSAAGLHFLAMALGILAAASAAHRLVPARGVTFTLVVASALSCASLLFLAVVSPPDPVGWRAGGVFFLGGGSGLLINSLFHAIHPLYQHDPAATVNMAGILFVLGCLTLALLVSGTFYVYTVASILFLIALIPGFSAGIFARSKLSRYIARETVGWKDAVEDFRSPGAVLFSLLLFFQFGNEWSIAGWLAVYLIQRLGVSPALSLFLLALYWFFLLAGRIVVQFLLPRIAHSRLLAVSALAALFGCLILGFTKSTFGAVFGILFVGGGFAAVYPLVVEKIGAEFPRFHPTLFNGIFSFAMIGGVLAPWTLGLAADSFGIGVLMLLPLAGTIMVLLLLTLLWIEAKLSGRARSI